MVSKAAKHAETVAENAIARNADRAKHSKNQDSTNVVPFDTGAQTTQRLETDTQTQESKPKTQAPLGSRQIKVVKASEVSMRRTEWFIDQWMPKGMITLLAGYEGEGKSLTACRIVSDATHGKLNDQEPINVGYIHTEDSREATVKPRLEAAGADMDKVLFFDVTEQGREGALELPRDNSLLEKELNDHKVKLVILDAAKSAMSSKLDGYRDDDVREFLEPLARIADRNGITILGLVHFGKKETDDVGSLIMGSRAWSQVARSVLAAAQPEEGRVVITNAKANLANKKVNREINITGVDVKFPDGTNEEVGVANWGDFTDQSAMDVVKARRSSENPASNRQQERNALAELISEVVQSHNGEAPASEVIEAAVDAGFTENQVKKARRKLGFTSNKKGFGKGAQFMWGMPPQPPETPDNQPVDAP